MKDSLQSLVARVLESGAVSEIHQARLVATAFPLEWAVAALAEDGADMAVAHLGHVALDIAPIGSSFGPDARTGR